VGSAGGLVWVRCRRCRRQFRNLNDWFRHAPACEEKESQDLREKRLKLDDFRCRLCGATRRLQVHHREPRSRGGKDELSNLITLCEDCHARQHPNIPRALFFSRIRRRFPLKLDVPAIHEVLKLVLKRGSLLEGPAVRKLVALFEAELSSSADFQEALYRAYRKWLDWLGIPYTFTQRGLLIKKGRPIILHPREFIRT